MKFQPIFKTTEQINSVATRFLNSYCPSRELPIDIESIIELKLQLDIIPISGLKDCFEKVGLDIDAFISSDFKSITVDQHVQEHASNRYRFTLAHEIGHMLLHGYLYKEFEFNTIDEWVKAIESIPLKQREMAEWQANEFAGLMLVPRSTLDREFQKALTESKKSFKNTAQNLIVDMAIRLSLAPIFKVSDSVVRIRLQRDGLIK